MIAVITIAGALTVNTGAQANDPSLLPLLSAESFQYLGGFRTPSVSANGDSFSYGGKVIAFSPTTNSLFVSSRAGRLAEVTIPAPVIASDVTQMRQASYLQPFFDPMEGHLTEVASSGAAISGLMVYNDRLYGTASIYYDASNTQTLSHFSRSTQLNLPSFSGWSRVWEAGKTGFVAGYLADVPVEWRSRLGGPAATGQCCIPIVSRTSWGPAALTFDPAHVGEPAVAASPVLYYTGEHATLGPWSGSNPTYGATIQMGGMAMIGGTRTAVFVGRNGTGPYCYGIGTSDPALDGTTSPDGSHWCYDPTSSDKGQHAYPYRYQLWAYDLNDFAAVKAGTKQPWEIVPYGVWPFDLPTYERGFKIGGVSYDAERQLLYVAQLGADKSGVASHPVIHVFQLNAQPAPVPVSAVSLSASHASPQMTNVSITFSAVPTGGVAPYEYKWAVSADGTTWTPAGSWTGTNTFVWTPTEAGTSYQIGVWARSSWNTADTGEANAAMAFPITEPAPPPPAQIDAVQLSVDKPAPQTTNTTMTFTAAPSGGVAPYQYAWSVSSDGTTWTAAGGWTASNTFSWTPTTANSNYQVSVWARSSWNTADTGEANAAVAFPITEPAPPPPAQIDAVQLSVNKSAPQTTNTTMTFTAAPSGGVAPYQYQWFVSDGTVWTAAGGWTASNTFSWTPTAANSNYQVRVWARSSWNTTDTGEANAVMAFPITQPAAAVKVGSVSLTSNLASPQTTGTTITWTATAVGGGAPLQYKWWVYDGVNWIIYSHWSTSNVFAWTPGTASNAYKIAVWVKSATNTRDEAEASASSAAYAISGKTVVVPPPPPQTSIKVVAVQIAPDQPAPQKAGTTITWTATATGGSAVLYKWWSFDGVKWRVMTGWSSSNKFAWTPTAPNAKYKVAVWAKSGTNTADAAEASASFEYVVNGPK